MIDTLLYLSAVGNWLAVVLLVSYRRQRDDARSLALRLADRCQGQSLLLSRAAERPEPPTRLPAGFLDPRD